jgi:transcriptional regulator with XRE-family HTH domain
MASTPTHLIGANVRAEMARRGLSQTALAARLGLSQTAVSKRLLGKTPWDVNELTVAADTLGVDVSELFAGVAA